MQVKIIFPIFLSVLLTALAFSGMAQQNDTLLKSKDTLVKKKDTLTTKKDTTAIRKKDTLTSPKGPAKNTPPKDVKLMDTLAGRNKGDSFRRDMPRAPAIPPAAVVPPAGMTIVAIPPDTATQPDSTLKNISRDSLELLFPLINTNKVTDRVLSRNKMINVKDPGIYYIQELRNASGKEFIFYTLCLLLFILALFKTFFSMYFNNLFRIFFNTSLRQSQLTDQLSQAKFPSFILNLFFTISLGIYIWLLFMHYNRVASVNPPLLLVLCIASVSGVYLVKYLILKFLGWLAGIGQVVDNYVFIIFLVNKISGVLLLPFILLLAFSLQKWVNSVAIVSALFLGILFLSRYAKSYGAIEKKFPVSSFHLFIFVVGAEIIPLLIFYKIAVDYLL